MISLCHFFNATTRIFSVYLAGNVRPQMNGHAFVWDELALQFSSDA